MNNCQPLCNFSLPFTLIAATITFHYYIFIILISSSCLIFFERSFFEGTRLNQS